jgi:hypothetical protein
VTREGHAKRLAVVSQAVASGEAPVRVLYFDDDDASRFIVFGSDVSYEHPERNSREDFHVICEHCLLEEHPEAGKGLDLARAHGSAYLADGEWVGEELD